MAYTGLDARLKADVFARDGHRCRWCGATNRGLDAHHIVYRRGSAYDHIDNLVSLCRAHHDFAHGNPLPNGQTIVKHVVQEILTKVIATPGLTGAALWRRTRRRWAMEGRCEMHGVTKDECLDCRSPHLRLVTT